MASEQAQPPSTDDLLYRRFPADWWHSSKSRKPLPQRVFRPRPWQSDDRQGDKDGLSVSQAAISTIEIASTCPYTKKRHSLASVEIAMVIALGVTIKPEPAEHDPGHALLPELNSLAGRDPNYQRWIEETAMALRNEATIVWEPRLGSAT